MDEEQLTGGRFSAPVRRGEVVERSTGPWSRNVHALLRHFESVGFDRAPRFLGHTADGAHERLGFIPGQAGLYPLTAVQRSDEALVSVVHTIRDAHNATTTFVPPDPAAWQAFTAVPAIVDCIGHHDLGPWNFIFDGPHVVGLIDWDVAGPSNRAWDLCYAAHRFVPLSSPRLTAAFGWPEPPYRAARLRLLTESYGHDIEPAELLDLLAVRLAEIAATIEAGVRIGDPAYDVHRDERHADAYREDLAFVVDHRGQLLS